MSKNVNVTGKRKRDAKNNKNKKKRTQVKENIYQQLGPFTFISKYAKYDSEKKRRETPEETSMRTIQMHAEKYKGKDIGGELDFAYNAMVNSKVLPSMRSFQFGGKPILTKGKNSRIYNCAATYVDRVEVFQHSMFMLLCGVGCGFSIQQHHIAKLPSIQAHSGENITYIAKDSIEGWSDCVGVLMSSYFTKDNTFPEYKNKNVTFDLTNIRPKGSPIANSNGKAPGPEPLQRSLMKIKEILDKCVFSGETRLKTIEIYDILMHISDAVLAGGIRRSATIIIFSHDDDLMLKAKTGTWYIDNPQRARSNNSALLLRKETKKKDFLKMFNSIKQFGEPGFIWADDKEVLFNPCMPDDTWIETDKGNKQIKELIGKPFNAIVQGKKYKSRTGFVKTGENKQLYKIETKEGNSVEATSNHKFWTESHNGVFNVNEWKQVSDMKIGEKIGRNRKLLEVNTITKITKTRVCDVYDCTVDDIHAFSANGFIAHNCVEASLYGYDEKGRSGFQTCNLSEINMGVVRNEKDFYEACRAAAIIGTLQAGYTDFGYLGEVTKRIVEKEALLGVSMTGLMDCPEIAFNPQILEKGCLIVKETNEKLAKKIGINPGARLTCVKPAGSTSCVFGTASGIHPRHATRYFRRVQVNKMEGTLEFFRKFNPSAIEESVWSANKTDDVITFLCEAPPVAKTKKDVTALELLETVKLVQKHWVLPGSELGRSTKSFVKHNVSNTINVAPGEWDKVAEYIYKNRNYFTGVALLSTSGDKDYNQAPFERVLDSKELSEEYGEASIFASGLITHAHQAFDGNLYKACACFLGFDKIENIIDYSFESQKQHCMNISNIEKHNKNVNDKKSFLARCEKFTKNFFSKSGKTIQEQKQIMTYCLKDVNAYHKWCKLEREYKPIDWSQFHEEDDNTKLSDYVACGGGQCTIVRM